MKRISHLYDHIDVRKCILDASKGKTKRKEVKKVLDNIDIYVHRVEMMLENKTYFMSPTYSRTIIEKGKERVLTISPFFPNRILDYIVTESLKPHIKRSMYEYCVGNVDKRGLTYGKKAISKRYKKFKYYIKLDIRHFYPSVKSETLMAFLETKIKDRDFLDLCRCVIGSRPDMPIGSYYSQWLSNWLLQGIDHAVKERFSIPLYVRYVDDMLLMANSKRKLLRAQYGISSMLSSIGLRLKEEQEPKSVSETPIDFLGFRFCESRVKIRIRIFKEMNKKFRKARKHLCLSVAESVLSYIGWLRQTMFGYRYYENRVKPWASIGRMRKIVSKGGIQYA